MLEQIFNLNISCLREFVLCISINRLIFKPTYFATQSNCNLAHRHRLVVSKHTVVKEYLEEKK